MNNLEQTLSAHDNPIAYEERPDTASYQVILYYRFVKLHEPAEYAIYQQMLCEELNLRGRVTVAEEGINGTLSGTIEQTKAYMDEMHKDPLFAGMPFKVDTADHHMFPRLSVRVKDEIVVMRAPIALDPGEKTGERLSPREFLAELAREDVIVLDGRNDYEYDIGHFQGAIRPDVRYFRDFPKWLSENLHAAKDQRIITYCTGGIRCEKLTSYLLEEGYENVAQLDGGIIAYAQDPSTQGEAFAGKCYVFDERIAVPINLSDEQVVGRCYHCSKPCERYINCAYDPCHLQHLCCETCAAIYNGYCSTDCVESATGVQAQL